METRVAIWTIALFILVSCWFYANSKLEIDYERYIQLVDKDTGVKHKPSELLDLAKIISPTAQYINSTNSIERLYDLAYLSTFENPFVIDQSYSSRSELLVSGWPVANKTRCTHQLEWILQQLNRNRNYSSLRGQLGYELTNYMDSFGRPESGLFSGSIHWIGSYKNCLGSRLANGTIKTRYCMLKMRFKSWPRNENIYPLTRIRLGVCLPESCDTTSYETMNGQINQLAMFDLPEKFKDNLEMDGLFCLPDERSPIRQIPAGGKVFLVIVGLWLAIVIAATVVCERLIDSRKLHKPRVDSYPAFKFHQKAIPSSEKQIGFYPEANESDNMQAEILEQIVRCISIRASIKAFKTNTFRVRYNEGQRVRLNLGCLDFFKVCMALLVVLAHASYLGSTHMRSMGSRVQWSTDELSLMAMTIGRCVDTFFLFFGILTSYNLLKKFKEHHLSNPLTWILVNIGILIRIAPLFMFVYWYSKLISPYTGSGPWWDYGVDGATAKGNCLNEPWWKSIPYFGSSGNPSVPTCNPPSWFIVSYSQLSLLMPLITYLLYKLPGTLSRCTLAGILLLVSASSIALRLALQTTVREEGITLYGAFLADLLEKFESTGHLTTLGRLGAVSIGCLVGYLLWCYENEQIIHWPKWLTSKLVNWFCLLSIITMIFLPIIGHRIHLSTGRMANWAEFVGLNVLLIILWPIFISILIITCTTKYNHRVWTRFFSHSFWHAFNRLGLCIFLIHWEILYMIITGFEQAPSHGFMLDFMKFWSFGVFFSLILGLVIHILIELPISNLLIFFLKLSTSKHTSSDNEEPQNRAAITTTAATLQ